MNEWMLASRRGRQHSLVRILNIPYRWLNLLFYSWEE
jgi:hypothetical protein